VPLTFWREFTAIVEDCKIDLFIFQNGVQYVLIQII
jgi:hypothetical protein